MRTWIGVGGSPESVVRAASYRIPLMLAIIGGDPRVESRPDDIAKLHADIAHLETTEFAW